MKTFVTIYNYIKFLLRLINTILIKPVRKILNFCNPFFKWYKTKWIKYTYDRFGDFVYKRALIFISWTIVCFYLIISAIGIIIDVSYYAITAKTETIYLSDSVELDSDSNIWGVKGCPTKNCDSNTALYFRIKTSWFNMFWNIFKNGRIFFPDAIAAGVPTGQSKCEVKSYGLRYRVLMMYNYYPQILQVKCSTVNYNEQGE